MSAASPATPQISTVDSTILNPPPNQPGAEQGTAAAASELAKQLEGLESISPTIPSPKGDEGWTISTQVYSDPNFPKITVGEFLAKTDIYFQKDIGRLVDDLFEMAQKNLQKIFATYTSNPNKEDEELTPEGLKKHINQKGRELIENALKKDIDASAANMVFFNTDDGPRLMVVTTQNTYCDNKKTLLALQVSNGPAKRHGSLEEGCNGYCAAELFLSEDLPKDEVNHIADVALGQPSQLFNNNQIPSDPLELVSKIVLNKFLKCQDLYFNVSVAKMNEGSIGFSGLDKQVKSLNGKLGNTDRKNAYQAAQALRSELGKLKGEDAVAQAITKAYAFLEKHDAVLTDAVRDEFSKKIINAKTQNKPIAFLQEAVRYGVMDRTQLVGVQLFNIQDIEQLVDEYNKAKAKSALDPIQFGNYFNAGLGYLAELVEKAKAKNPDDLNQSLVAVLNENRQALALG